MTCQFCDEDHEESFFCAGYDKIHRCVCMNCCPCAYYGAPCDRQTGEFDKSHFRDVPAEEAPDLPF